MITRRRNNQFFVLASLFVVLVFFVFAGMWVSHQQSTGQAEAQVEAAALGWSTGSVHATNQYTNPKLVLDSSGNLHLAGFRSGDNTPDYGYCDSANDCTSNANWSFYQVGPDTGVPSGLVRDSSNNLFMLYKALVGGASRLATCLIASGCDETGDWSIYDITGIDDQGSIEFRIDSNNNLHVAYITSANEVHYSNCLIASGCDEDSDWTTVLIYDPAVGEFITSEIDLHIDANNNPIITFPYRISAGNNTIRYASCSTMGATDCDDALDWSSYQLLPTQANQIMDIEVDSEGSTSIVMVFSEISTDEYKYIRCLVATSCDAQGDWSTAYAFDDGRSFTLSIGLDITGSKIVTTYGINSPTNAYLAAECDITASSCDAPSDWGITTVDLGAAGSGGVLTSDGAGIYYASYPDNTESAFKLAVGISKPEVVSTAPVQNLRNADSTSPFVQVQFSKTMSGISATQSNLPFYVNGNLVSGSYNIGTISITNDTFTFLPTNDFPVGKRVVYTATDGLLGADTSTAVPYIGSFISEVTAGTGTFFANKNLPGSFPVVTESVDLDNDQDMDIISVGGTTLGIFLNDGSGGFASVATTTLLSNARSVALGDFNLDGFNDIAVNHFGAASFSILLNNGSGAFPTRVDYASGGVGIGIESGDIDADGDLDLVVANSGTNSISTFLNNGSGIFSADQTLTTSSTSPRHIAIGDMDNDGDLDLFNVDGAPSVNVFENDGTGIFSRTNLVTTSSPFDIEAVDINADNDLDLVISTNLGDISTFIGNGDGTFAARVDLDAGDAEGLAFGDVDNDGDIDFFSVDNAASQLDIILNNGSGILSVGGTYDIGSNPSGVSTADYNGDGALDFAATGTNDSEVNVFFADASPAVLLIQPNGGERIAPGSTYTIQWSAQDDSGGVSSISLEFDDGGGFSAIAGATGLSTHAFNYPYVQEIGGSGTGDGQWWGGPYFSDIDADGNIYGTDPTLARVNKFDSEGNWLGCLDTTASGFVSSGCGSGSGSADGQFSFPRGVAVDASGNIYVAEHGNSRIQKFDSNGNFLLKWGSAGSGNGQFNVIQDIEVDSNGNIFVMDRDNRRIQKFTSSGTYLTQWGSDGTGDGQFSIGNQYIAVDSNDNVWAIGQNRVQKFSNTGTFLGCLDSSASGLKLSGCLVAAGSALGQFSSPQDGFIDGSGNIFVVDSGNDRIQKFDSSGNFVLFWQASGSGTGEFNYAYALDGRSNGNIIVGDPNNKKFIEYSALGEFEWTVPASETETARIRITADDGVTNASQDTSDADFTIGVDTGNSRQNQAIIDQQNQQLDQEVNETDSDTEEVDPTEETISSPTEPEENLVIPPEETNEIDQNVEESIDQLDQSEGEIQEEAQENQEEILQPPNPEEPVQFPTQEETETIEPTIRDLILQTPGIQTVSEPAPVLVPEQDPIPMFSLEAEFVPAESGLNYQGVTNLPGSVISVTINKQTTKLINTNERGEWMSFVSAAELGLVPGEVRRVVLDLVAASGGDNTNRVEKVLHLYLSKDGKTVKELVNITDLPVDPILPKSFILGVLAIAFAGLVILWSFYRLALKKQNALVNK